LAGVFIALTAIFTLYFLALSILNLKEKNMKKQLLVHAVVTAMLGMSAPVMAAEAPAMEKCYGIAKAGKNDCGTIKGNACAAQIKQDKSPVAWIFVPKGTCDKIAGGSTSVQKT